MGNGCLSQETELALDERRALEGGRILKRSPPRTAVRRCPRRRAGTRSMRRAIPPTACSTSAKERCGSNSCRRRAKWPSWPPSKYDAFFGETCLLGKSVRVATAVCLTDCVLVRMAKANAIRALQSDPQFAGFLLMRVMHRARRLRARLISQLFESSEQRLARILLMLANGGGDS